MDEHGWSVHFPLHSQAKRHPQFKLCIKLLPLAALLLLLASAILNYAKEPSGKY
jgi:hypothetical protein